MNRFQSYESLSERSDNGSTDGEKCTIKEKLQSIPVLSKCLPPKGELANLLTLAISTIGIFLAARTILGDAADVGGTVFALLMLILLSLLGGKCVLAFCWLLKKLSRDTINLKLPPLLGMIVVGILLKNIPYHVGQFGRGDCMVGNETIFVDSIHDRDLVRTYSEHCYDQSIGHDMDPYITRTLRSVCLTVILLMAGLEIDPVALWRLSGMVLRASFIPCLIEALVIAVLSHFLLGFPWPVGFMLGFVLAAVSPAVIIPCLMNLSQQGLGVEKGIPTLVIAACSLDDVIAISGFGIFLGIYFSAGKQLWELILHGPFEILLGATFGIIWGFLSQWIPNKEHIHVGFFRWLILFSGGLIAIFGSEMLHYAGAGGLATVVMGTVAGIEWRNGGWGVHNPVTTTFSRMWIILEPILFGLIGTAIQVDKINSETFGLSILIVILALLLRMVATYASVSGGDLNWKEKIFMSIAWIPKATVQAALGPIFLHKVNLMEESYWDTESNRQKWLLSNPHKNSTDWDPLIIKRQWEEWGENILTIAVLSILVTAPVGAILISSLGPKLLDKDEYQDDNESEAEK